MADPEAVRRYLETVGVRTSRRPVVRGMDERPPGAREVSRAEFERVRDRRPAPVVTGIDIGDAEMLSEEEAEALDALSRARDSHPSYPTDQRPSMEQFARMGDEAATIGRARQSRQSERMRPETIRGNVAAGLPSGTPEVVVRGIAATPAAAAFDPDLGAAAEHGVTQGLTFGHEDEIAGLVRGGVPGTPGYVAERDRVRQQQDEAQANAPVMYGASEVVGGLPAAALVPGASPGASLGRRVLASGLGGAGFGAASGSGHSRAELGSPEYARDVGMGAGAGAMAGMGAEVGLDVARTLRDAIRPAPGTPRPGGDFTPEQGARIDADPELRMRDVERQRLEMDAATRRVQSAYPSATADDLARIDREYPGGRVGMARDMAESGIAPRRSWGSNTDVQDRAAMAAREPGPPPSTTAVPPPAEPQMPPGTRAGQFADDDMVVGPARTVENPPSRPVAGVRIDTDALPADPHDAVPFDPSDTLEAQLHSLRARDPESTGRAPMSAEDIARSQESTAPRGRARPQRPAPVVDMDEPIVFSEGMGPPPTPPDARPLPPHLQRPPAVVQGIDADEPIDFAMMDAPAPRQQGGAFGDAHDARVRSNIEAAERRSRRGGYSSSTHDERTWPVDIAQTQEVPQPPPLPRRQASPPPLPPRAPAPAPRQAAPDLGRWDAPTVEAPPAVPGPSSRQRVAGAVTELGQRQRDAALTAPRPQWGERGQRMVEDLFLDTGRVRSMQASGLEGRADRIARDISRRLSQSPETRALATQLERAYSRGARAYGAALITMARREPEVAAAIEESFGFDQDYQHTPANGATGTDANRAATPTSEWDIDYSH